MTSHGRTRGALLTTAMVTATAIALAAPVAGCWGSSEWNPFARQPAPAAPVVATPIDADAVTISEPSPWIVRYRVALPPMCAPLAGGTLKLRFVSRLDGAKVDAFVEGPRQRVGVLHGKRVGSDTVAVPLAPGTLDTVDVWVHRRLRSPPIVRDAVIETSEGRVGAPTLPPSEPPAMSSARRSRAPLDAITQSAARPPLAASGR